MCTWVRRPTFVPLALAAIVLAAYPSFGCAEDSTTRILVSLDTAFNLSSTKAALVSIDSCRAKLPEGATKDQLTLAEESLIEGLLIGWDPGSPVRTRPIHIPLQLAVTESQRWKRPSDMSDSGSTLPDIYVKSLDRDAKACEFAAANPGRAAEAGAALESVITDLNIKAEDCYLHGMGRTISFKVKTMKGQAQDRGWTVYFKWQTVSNLETDEIPFPKASSPAFDDLPPGVYKFRAERRDPVSSAMANSETKVCVVDEAHQECELQVP